MIRNRPTWAGRAGRSFGISGDTLRAHPRSSDHGATLAELAVVVLIITLLLAVSIPVFLGAQRRARDRVAQSLAREVLGAARTIFTVDEDYLAADIASIMATEPSLTIVASNVASTSPRVASVATPDAVTLVVAVYSTSGRCFYLRDRAVPVAGGTRFASADATTTPCTADGAPPAGQFQITW